MLVVMFCVYAWLISRRRLAREASDAAAAGRILPPPEHYTLREKIRASGPVMPLMAVILLIIVALYGGIATPSEVAAIGALLAFAYVAVYYKVYRPADLKPIFGSAIRESCMILLVIAASGLFAYMMSVLYVTQSLADTMVSMDLNRWVMLAVIIFFLLVAGCFLPPVALILMTMQILQPILELNGFDMIWFGIVMTIALEIGLITPPLGLNLYVLRAVAPQVPLYKVLWGSVPFILLMLLGIVLLCLFPALALWLPTQMMR
jgi:C4-dicarboxylate transporter, DctM subunit